MKNRAIILLTCVSLALAGCSSKPDIGDIEHQLKEGWGTCQGLKMTSLKKTNGIERSKSYAMSISYKLEITKNATPEEAWLQESICPSTGMLQLLIEAAKADNKYGNPLKAGDVINVNDTFNMVKSEKGWISQ